MRWISLDGRVGVGITASFSILDHMDGLCAGVAAMASIFFAMIAYLNGQTLVTTLAAAVWEPPQVSPVEF